MLKNMDKKYILNPDFKKNQYDLPTSIPIEVVDLNLAVSPQQ